MNQFEKLRQKILAEHPSYKALPLLDRLRIWYRSDNEEITLSHVEGSTHYNQSAILVRWKGKTYHYKWGRLPT